MILYSDAEKLIYDRVVDIKTYLDPVGVYPTNFTVKGETGDFLRVTILFGEGKYVQRSVDGSLVVEIYSKQGSGTHTVYTYADYLNLQFVGKSLNVSNTTLQFHNSNLAMVGTDKDDFSYHRSIYTLPFTLEEIE